MKNYLVVMILFCSTSLFAQHKTFPQRITYPNGILPTMNRDSMDNAVRFFYHAWKARFIKDIPGTDQSYVDAYDKKGSKGKYKNACAFSEGQGYGMMIMAYMAGVDPDAEAVFNRLYNYCIHHPSRRDGALMAWVQDKNFIDIEKDGASDGDIDIAYALILADAQWGSNKIPYLGRAKKILASIEKQEINDIGFLIMKGNDLEKAEQYDKGSKDYFDTRPSDFMPSEFRTFYAVTHNNIWLRVIDSSYALFDHMRETYSPGTALMPDFIQRTKAGVYRPAYPKSRRKPYEENRQDSSYYYNACRVPWRLGPDYLLYNEPRSKKLLDTINLWIKTETGGNPLNISPGYALNGTPFESQDEKDKFDAMCYLAPFAVSAMCDPAHREWLNDLWNFMLYFDGNKFKYFDNTIRLLNMIIISGNYWVPAR